MYENDDNRDDAEDTLIAVVRFRKGARDAPPPDRLAAPAVFCHAPETAGDGCGKWTLCMEYLDDHRGWLKLARIGWLVKEAETAWMDGDVLEGEEPTFHVYEGTTCVADGVVVSTAHDPSHADGDISRASTLNAETGEFFDNVLERAHHDADLACRESHENIIEYVEDPIYDEET